jgi:hypothetical protein
MRRSTFDYMERHTLEIQVEMEDTIYSERGCETNVKNIHEKTFIGFLDKMKNMNN